MLHITMKTANLIYLRVALAQLFVQAQLRALVHLVARSATRLLGPHVVHDSHVAVEESVL